jgi:hypothetical protein
MSAGIRWAEKRHGLFRSLSAVLAQMLERLPDRVEGSLSTAVGQMPGARARALSLSQGDDRSSSAPRLAPLMAPMYQAAAGRRGVDAIPTDPARL